MSNPILGTIWLIIRLFFVLLFLYLGIMDIVKAKASFFGKNYQGNSARMIGGVYVLVSLAIVGWIL